MTAGSPVVVLRLFFLSLLWLPVCGLADAPRQLTWQDLLPAVPKTENPFARLTVEQRRALADLASIRDRRARGEAPLTAHERDDEVFLVDHLRKSGIDPDALLATREKMMAQQRSLAQAANPSLDGAVVRMPGYMLPLDYSGKEVSEFLLVPWVGACIHTPPPPPNQIVHVRLERPTPYDGLFKPVMVTGRMSASVGRKSVFLVDGSSEIDTSYAMRATRVEPYAE